MRIQLGVPDSSPPGLRRLGYGFSCWMNRHPALYRLAGSVLRRWPALSAALRIPARREAVVGALQRPTSFLNTSHNPNLVAGEFLLGMEPGPRYTQERKLFDDILRPLRSTVPRLADAEAQRRLAEIELHPTRAFNLIDDYLMPIVFRAIETAFSTAAPCMAAGSRYVPPDPELEHQYMLELRHVAAYIFGGKQAPSEVQRRAEMCAESLRQRVGGLVLDIRYAWGGAAMRAPTETIRREAVGLAWISHPVTVQSGALVMQELLGRRDELKALQRQAGELLRVGTLWTDSAFRDEVGRHVLEAMRFRPIFPLLARDVPRDTLLDVGGRRQAKCPAGSSIVILTLAAMFDPLSNSDQDAYCPHRNWGEHDGDRYMMFGYGTRQCPGRGLALEMLTSAMIGLLSLPQLRWGARRGFGRMVYDGPMTTRMPLRFGP